MKFSPHQIARSVLFQWNTVAPALAIVAIYYGHWMAGFIAVFVGHFFWLLSTFLPNLSIFGKVICRFKSDPNEKQVWLTIDDGPDPIDTPYLLNLLDSYGAKATFFFIGEKVEQYPHLAQEVVARGHHIANHTFTHPEKTFWAAFPKRIHEEWSKCQQVISQTTKTTPTGFRAPVGFKNPWLEHYLDERRIPLIGWTHRGFDGKWKDPVKILKHLLKDIHSGSIFLVHEGKRDLTGHSLCPSVVKPLIDHLSANGYKCIIPSPEQWR